MSDDSALLKVSTFRSKTDRTPRLLDVSWATLTHKLSQYEFRESKDGPLFSPAEYAPEATRSVANVLRVHFLGLDFDAISDEDFILAVEKLSGVRCCVYATWSQAETKRESGRNCYRVIVALSRPVPAQQWPRFFAKAVARFGGKHDNACKDAARMFYLPSMPFGAESHAFFDAQEGEPLDVDSVLSGTDPEPSDLGRDQKEIFNVSDEMRNAFAEKAQRQLTKAVKTILAVKRGEPRHPVINRLSFQLGKLCPHLLDEETVYRRIFDASQGMADPLPPERAEDEIRRALEDGKKEPDDPTDGWMGLLTRQGKELTIAPSASNVVTILLHDPRWMGVFGYDERLCKVAFLREPPLHADIALGDTPPACSVFGDGNPYPRYMLETDIMSVQIAIERVYRISLQTTAVGAAIERVARERTFDPVLQYLDALSWDGTNRIDNWAVRYLGAKDTDFTRAAGAAWLIQAVKRTYEPGCQADYVLVLEGDQGARKTTALKILGGRWFTDSIGDTRNKDTYVNLLGKWIVELAELDSMKRAESTSFKAFVTNRDDYFREPYDRHASSHPRRCVFAGSTNEENYLQDPTGARRFWPISVINVDVEALTRDRDQIWAEAVYAMRAGRPCYLDAQQHVEQAKIEQERRYSADEWENVVSEYLSDNGLHSVTVPTLLLHALKIDAAKWTRSDQMRVATAMKRLGWERRKATAPNGQRFWEYVPGPKALVVPAEPLPANVLAFRNSMRGRTVPGPVASGPGMGPTPAGSNASVLPLRKPDRPDTA